MRESRVAARIASRYASPWTIPLDPFSLLIGEVLHNLRSSFDHLAYALAAKHTQPLTEEIVRHSEFPIYGDKYSEGIVAVEKRHAAVLKKKIGGIAPQAQIATVP